MRPALEPLAAAGQVARAGISDLEVGCSARNLSEWTRLAAALAAVPLIETDAVHLRRARQVQRLLAAAAEENGVAVLHYHADFDLITRVTGQPCAWVVPAGSID